MKSQVAKIENAFHNFINRSEFPCIGAKASLAKDGLTCMVAGNMACPADDPQILKFLYSSIDQFRSGDGKLYSAVIIFDSPRQMSETQFEQLMWMRLQNLATMDAKEYAYDQRVSPHPLSPDYSFSIKEEAYYIIGLHAGSSRPARRFTYPALVFNPHAQFELMKETTKYQSMQKAIRKKDITLAGSVNPMLTDHGQESEAKQYSGIHYTNNFECPLKMIHGN